MASNSRLASLRKDFESGARSVAFVPYASALRRDRLYPQALDVCLQGLSANPQSLAGRTLLGLLYCDLGNYAQSLEILREVCAAQPDAFGARVALARTLLRVRDTSEAEPLVQKLATEAPMIPEVQLLGNALRQLQVRERLALRAWQPQRGVNPFAPPTTMEELLDAVVQRLQAGDALLGAMLASLSGSFEPVSDKGRTEGLYDCLEVIREIRRAYVELEFGEPFNGQFIFEFGIVLFACREDFLILAALRNDSKLGRIKLLFEQFSTQYLMVNSSADTHHSEVKP